MRKATIAVPLPDSVYKALRRVFGGRSKTGTRDLTGDRDIEWSWVASQMPQGPGECLDFGPGGSSLSLIAGDRGYRVTAVDLGAVDRPYQHDALTFVQGDILELPFEDGRFDLVLNCSTVEHVGLVGRYGVRDARPDGDLEAMARLRDLMKPNAKMLLTIPVGKDAVFPPLHRVYGEDRLPRLLEGFQIEREVYWLKGGDNRWVVSDASVALVTQPEERLYGLGCFVLIRSD